MHKSSARRARQTLPSPESVRLIRKRGPNQDLAGRPFHRAPATEPTGSLSYRLDPVANARCGDAAEPDQVSPRGHPSATASSSTSPATSWRADQRRELTAAHGLIGHVVGRLLVDRLVFDDNPRPRRSPWRPSVSSTARGMFWSVAHPIGHTPSTRTPQPVSRITPRRPDMIDLWRATVADSS